MFTDALDVRQNVLGPNHRDVAQAHSNLGTACHELRDNAAAKQHFEKALAILEAQITTEKRSFEATSLDYIALLEMNGDQPAADAVKTRLASALARM
jgi:hypothetical protein